MSNLQMLIDRADIEQMLVQYCRAVDRRDLAMLKDVYWPDATDDHGFFVGNGHEFAEWNVARTSEGMPLTQHFITNFWCQVDGDRAVAESYVLAYHQIIDNDAVARRIFGPAYMDQQGTRGSGGHALILGGQWFDQFERRDDVWRIKHRVATTHWDLPQPLSKVLLEGVFKSTPSLSPGATALS